MTTPVILHADMDAFYASVEILRRPELATQPVIVGGEGPRGVVAAASYVARHYGVRSAMPSTRARRLCPQAVFVHGDHEHYRSISRRVMEIFSSYTPLVEPLSLDEAFLDVTGATRLFGSGHEIGHKLRQAVFDQEGLWCSVGVAPVKFIAKMASVRAKPSASLQGPVPGDGVFEVRLGTELDFLHPQPVSALWGVGPSTLKRLDSLGVETIGDLAALPVETVVRTLGKASGRSLHALANGRDERRVESVSQTKSVSHEETFATDKHDHGSLNRDLVRMADAVADRLRAADLRGRTITIKVRYNDFETLTRSHTLDGPTDSGVEVARHAKVLLARVDPSRGVRLLGVGVTGFGAAPGRQLTLDEAQPDAVFGSDDHAAWHDADMAIDDIRNRFGRDAIGPAVLAEGGEGVDVKRQGEQQWGPNK